MTSNVILQVLKDIPVLICRPEPSATDLANALKAVGAKCETLPCLKINTLKIEGETKQRLLDLDQYSSVVALSQYAAKPALDFIDEYWPQPPVQQTWYAIGRKTADLISGNVATLVEPEADLSSEELLELPGLQNMEDERVLILKGIDGRDTIEKELVKRGAKVENVELYERVAPSYSDEEVSKALVAFSSRCNSSSNYIVALSGETVKNLKRLADQIKQDLSEHHLIVPSERVAHVAMQAGFKLTYIPNNLKPIDIIRCIANIEGQLKNTTK